MSRRSTTVVALVGSFAAGLAADSLAGESESPGKEFRAGAAAVEITPTTLPVIVSGGFLQRTARTPSMIACSPAHW